MTVATEAVTLGSSHEDTFSFLADPANLPRWAVNFARSVRRDGEQWFVETPEGELALSYVTDPDHGVIDFHWGPAPEQEAVAHSRVVATGEGSAFVFIMEQSPGQSDEAFAQQRAALREELAQLRSLLEP